MGVRAFLGVLTPGVSFKVGVRVFKRGGRRGLRRRRWRCERHAVVVAAQQTAKLVQPAVQAFRPKQVVDTGLVPNLHR